MAFTQAQEDVLKQLIEAFQNGKRLSDLPNVKGTNPYDLYLEVLDTDGESKKAQLAALLPYIEEQCAYGIVFDTTISTPNCTRIGNSDLHKTLPIQSRMRGVLLSDEGKVVEYLDPKDWTGQTRDGSRGQVMVEIPLHYRRFETDGNKRRVLLSEFPLPGYHQVPLSYVSAYEATIQRSTNTLCSVANDSADYRGGNNRAEYDGTSKTLLGRPASAVSRTNFRAYARKRKPNTSEWNCMTYGMQKTLFWLFAVEYATLNSQAGYNAEPTVEGFRQGGLGAGVSTLDVNKWNTLNSFNPFIPCGYTDHIGNATGVVQYTMPSEYDTTAKTVDVPRYRGVENPFGHIWTSADGINILVSAQDANGGDGLSKVFVCDTPSMFKDNDYDGYSHVGNEARNESYVKKVIFGEGGEIMPSICNGAGTTTYFCDYHYVKIPTTGDTLCGGLFGGGASDSAGCGFAFANTRNAPSAANANTGTRLCFIPE